MLNVLPWQKNDFLDNDNYQKLKEKVGDLWPYGKPSSALDIYEQLKDKEDLIADLGEHELREGYKSLMRKLFYTALPFISDDEVIAAFKSNIVDSFNFQNEGYDILEKIKDKLLTMPLAVRDSYKARLIKALEENQENLTSTQLDRRGERTTGTVENWLTDFRRYMNERQLDQKLIKAEYLIKSANASRLTSDEKFYLEKLIDLYNQLQISSLTIEGLEGPEVVDYKGRTYLVDRGKMTALAKQSRDKTTQLSQAKRGGQQEGLERTQPVGQKLGHHRAVGSGSAHGVTQGKSSALDDKGNKSEDLKNIYSQFLQTELMSKVEQRYNQLQGKLKNNVKEIRNSFYHAVNNNQVDDALVSLIVAAESAKLHQVFAEDERFIKFWKSYLSRHNLASQDFEKNPGDAKHIAGFIKYVLEERLSFPQKTAVLFGVLLSNLARQSGEVKYQQIAYGDLASGKFRWQI